MPLSDDDCLELLRHLQTRLRQADPELFDKLGMTIIGYPPYEQLQKYLHGILMATKEKSGMIYHNMVLPQLEYIKSAKGKRIESILIALSPEEQQLYQVQQIELERLPNYTDFIKDLFELERIIDEERRR